MGSSGGGGGTPYTADSRQTFNDAQKQRQQQYNQNYLAQNSTPQRPQPTRMSDNEVMGRVSSMLSGYNQPYQQDYQPQWRQRQRGWGNEGGWGQQRNNYRPQQQYSPYQDPSWNTPKPQQNYMQGAWNNTGGQPQPQQQQPAQQTMPSETKFSV